MGRPHVIRRVLPSGLQHVTIPAGAEREHEEAERRIRAAFDAAPATLDRAALDHLEVAVLRIVADVTGGPMGKDFTRGRRAQRTANPSPKETR